MPFATEYVSPFCLYALMADIRETQIWTQKIRRPSSGLKAVDERLCIQSCKKTKKVSRILLECGIIGERGACR